MGPVGRMAVGGGMSDRTDGERLAAIEENLKNLGREIGELKSEVRGVLKGCPECKACLAAQDSEIKNLKADLEKLEGRVWKIAGSTAAGSAVLAVIVSWLLKGG